MSDKVIWTVENVGTEMINGFTNLCGQSNGILRLEAEPGGNFTAICRVPAKKSKAKKEQD